MTPTFGHTMFALAALSLISPFASSSVATAKPEHIDILSFSWGVTPGSARKGLHQRRARYVAQ
jgi:hypothetical protein